MIVCTDQNWAIGNGNKLLAHLPSDLKYFKELTQDNIVLMGRKTLESLPNGKPLKNRINIVLTNNPPKDKDGSNINYTDNIEDIKYIADSFDHLETFVIGGGSIYSQLLPYCDRAYVTMMYKEFEADTYISNLGADEEWELIHHSDLQHENGIDFRYLIYERKL